MWQFRIFVFRLVICVLAAVPATSVPAQNLEFLTHGPIAYLNDADRQIFKDTFNTALNDAGDGESLRWKNPDTGSHGMIEVDDTHEDYGTTCRVARVQTDAGGRAGRGEYRLCRASDGTWQFAPPRLP